MNLTNHTYFNLSGNGSRRITEHYLHLSCDQYLPVDSTQIPTGEIRNCVGSAFDFNSDVDVVAGTSHGVLLGDRIPHVDGGGQPGFDHCFVVNGNSELRHAATLTDELSGRQLIVSTTSPGIQVYTCNFLSSDQTLAPFVQHNAVCLETQQFPDAINQPLFPNCVIRPGDRYESTTVFAFGNVNL